MSEPSQPQVAVDVRAVEKHFHDGGRGIHALKQVNLRAFAGEILMLVGPSGCGKTTVLSAIAGTLRVESGEIDVMGNPVHRMSAGALTAFRARTIGFIFQQFHLIPTISVAENVGVPLLIRNAPKRQVIDRARAALEAVGLGDRWKERPNRLSGGQQQRVAIARALVHEPPLVICDEPTAALDARNGEIVLELFRNVACSPDRAVLIVTHDNRIFSYADRIARMDDGEIVSVQVQDHAEPPHFIHEHA